MDKKIFTENFNKAFESLFAVMVFDRAWQNRVRNLLGVPGALNSERALQAELCGVFAPFSPQWLVLVEPTVLVPSFGKGRTIRPDMIISRQIATPDGTTIRYDVDLVVELKIQHRGKSYPDWFKDYENIAAIALHPESTVKVNQVGFDNRPHRFHGDTHFISAVIAKHDSHALDPKQAFEKALSEVSEFRTAWKTTTLRNRFFLEAAEWGREGVQPLSRPISSVGDDEE